jgi:hypothetical protein
MFPVADTKAYYWTKSSAIFIHLCLEIHPRVIVPPSLILQNCRFPRRFPNKVFIIYYISSPFLRPSVSDNTQRTINLSMTSVLSVFICVCKTEIKVD